MRCCLLSHPFALDTSPQSVLGYDVSSVLHLGDEPPAASHAASNIKPVDRPATTTSRWQITSCCIRRFCITCATKHVLVRASRVSHADKCGWDTWDIALMTYGRLITKRQEP